MRRFILSITLSALCFGTASAQDEHSDLSGWLTGPTFNVKDFRNPDIRYAPFTRWWWPGNDVSPEELRRELRLFADSHIGGVEIQPFALVIPMDMARAAQVMSFDTDSYYDNLDAVMQEAMKLGLTVDLTHGSGWPASSSIVTEDKENRSLQFGMTDIPTEGGKVRLPRSERQDSRYSTLVGILSAQVEEGEGPRKISDVKDISSLMDPTDSTVTFKAGASGKMIALWSVPSQETNMIIAKAGAGNVLDHFDKKTVQQSYDYYFGERTGLEKYYGKPFRSIFNDSYEFKVDRHFTEDFLTTFKRRRGYDALPYLPANIWYGYNNMYDNGHAFPEFTFSDEDWRLRYDYDMTASDLIREHLLKGSAQWAEPKGLLHRTQAYGLPMDWMGAAGDASIPETECMMFGGGTEGALKIVSSGAMLYNRPLVSAESGVHYGRALMVTPQKLRLTADKLLTSGINQIIWHGTPYKYTAGGAPWQPFFNSLMSINFSSDINEANVFWDAITQVNAYIQRAQYLMRCGKAEADVLIYYPFLEYSSAAANPEEILDYGYLPKTEPPMSIASDDDSPSGMWLKKLWPLVNELTERGITWAWVNDESLREMKADRSGDIVIRGNRYKGLILFDLPYIPLETARHLKSQKKANILAIGDAPSIQPSFKDYTRNDARTARIMKTVFGRKNVHTNGGNWKIATPTGTVSGGEGLRLARRRLSDGTVIQMYWNFEDKVNSSTISVRNGFAYWLDAESGTVTKAEKSPDGEISMILAPYSSIFLALSDTPIEASSEAIPAGEGRTIATLASWDITSGRAHMENSVLFDWRDEPYFKDSGEEGVYKTDFTVDGLPGQGHLWLDLGDVYYTADVTLNGQSLGMRVFKPFRFDVTGILREGANSLEIKVGVTDYNAKAALGRKGDTRFATLPGGGSMANGLRGPVRIIAE
ncbi:MAG: glycosyl hydrolase family 2 [Bacteroidales bacterium]|nr:glycosyl hydrolase family 2 [Bacteroidales bacterium]